MRRVVAWTAALAVGGIAVLAFLNHRAASRLERPFTADSLTGTDRRALAEARRLKAAYGQSVWPGFGRADLPQILYNDRWEFLAGWSPPPPAGWVRSPGDDLFEVSVWRRRAEDPGAFALEIEGRWAGRYPVRRLLNRRRVREARGGMDPLSAALVPVGLSTVATDLYVVQLLHTAFHAFQATRARDRFYRSVRLRARAAPRYPFDRTLSAELWTREGEALGGILAARGPDDACRSVEAFRAARSRRRDRAVLDSTLVAYEQAQEWLQGLAKYAAFTFYRRAAGGKGAPEGVEYRSEAAPWEGELAALRSSLGQQGPGRRFALSGLGQALALERLAPGWKPGVLPGDRTLESLLYRACGPYRGGRGESGAASSGGG